jgi:hypothetical protein
MRHRLAPYALLLLLAAAAGCSARTNEPGVATAATAAASARPSPTPSLSDQERQIRFAECMRDHGVNVPDPGSNGGRVQIQANDKGKAQAALQACQQYLPGGTLPGPPSAAQLNQMREFAKCMRDHGVNVPDPDPNSGGIRIGGGPGQPGKDDPKLQQAMQACQDKLPGQVTGAKPGGNG